jgi:hypothetical protein
MREIVSAVGSPTHKLAKWLVEEFKGMPKQFESRSVTSSQAFTQQMQTSGCINEDELMVSFDVKALFPSVPVKEAINLLEEWLLSQKEEAAWKNKVRMYLKLTRLCMEENYFTFRGCFYKQTKGAPMGNPLSPFICELFMAHLEAKLQTKNILPTRWWRYVDDVFTIVKREALTKIMAEINSIHKDITFTHEVENDGKLAFLDLLIVREPSISSSMSYEIFRKPTSSQRVIPYTSNHSFQQKMAAFHHMIHRMLTLPLGEAAKDKELQYIFETARLNGYNRNTIQAIIDKKLKELLRKSQTTLTNEIEPLRRVAVPFDEDITRKLRPKLMKFGLDLVFSSRNNQLKSLLGSTKDPVKCLNKAGVYKISCKQCNKVYIGQTKRTLETRFKEHTAEVKKAAKQEERGLQYDFKSMVAEHIHRENHQLTLDDIDILRSISAPWKLDVAESLEINKHHPSSLLNRDSGNGYTWLFKLLPKSEKQPNRGAPVSRQ